MYRFRSAYVCAVCFCCCWLPVAAVPAATIVVGDHDLLPETPSQTVQLFVSGGEPVQGLNLRAQVADGGPHPQVGGSILGPTISGIDLLTDTIFAGNSTGQSDLLNLPQVWVQSTTTLAGTVPAQGLLATLTIDTTGFQRGTFDLSLGDTHDGATDFAGLPIDITDGTIQIVPEPTSFTLLLLGCAAVALRNRRGRTARLFGSGRRFGI